jgi:hypothetical protein
VTSRHRARSGTDSPAVHEIRRCGFRYPSTTTASETPPTVPHEGSRPTPVQPFLPSPGRLPQPTPQQRTGGAVIAEPKAITAHTGNELTRSGAQRSMWTAVTMPRPRCRSTPSRRHAHRRSRHARSRCSGLARMKAQARTGSRVLDQDRHARRVLPRRLTCMDDIFGKRSPPAGRRDGNQQSVMISSPR